MSELIELGKKLELVSSYAKLGRDYGLFTKKISVKQPGGAPKEYLAFSLNPIKDNFDPVEVINRNKRNHNLFYPEDFAVELGSENPLLMWERISTYLGYAEFMYELYNQFDTPLPEVIRTDELEALVNFYCNYQDPGFDAETRMEYLEGIRAFFADESEKSKSKFKQEWHKFYRSELFDGKKSFVQNFFAFIKRHEPETSLNTLIESNGDFKKVYMPEYQYKRFHEVMREQYPEVKYSTSEIRVVDKGIITDPKTGARVETQYGVTVTDEEYAKIMDERFDAEGNACLDGLNISYYSGRDVFYKACDENIIASVSHGTSLTWTRCCDLKALEARDELRAIEMPVGHLKNFYAEMKAYKAPFYIDYDVNHSPNFETLRIVYNACDANTVQNILIGLTMMQANLSHISASNQNVMFGVSVPKIDALIQRASARALTGAEGGDMDRLSENAKDLEV